MADAPKATRRTGARDAASDGVTAEERAAIGERARGLKASGRRGVQADDERAVLAKLAELPEPDRCLGERLHALITAHAPGLVPRLRAGICQRRPDRVLLSGGAQVQDAVRDGGLPRRGAARRRPHVADGLGADRANRRRRGADRRPAAPSSRLSGSSASLPIAAASGCEMVEGSRRCGWRASTSR